MGWTEDYEDKLKEMGYTREDLSEMGKAIWETGDVEALQEFASIYEELGMTEEAESTWASWRDWTRDYEDEYEGKIRYEADLKRWRATASVDVWNDRLGKYVHYEPGQFVCDPYRYRGDLVI